MSILILTSDESIAADKLSEFLPRAVTADIKNINNNMLFESDVLILLTSCHSDGVGKIIKQFSGHVRELRRKKKKTALVAVCSDFGMSNYLFNQYKLIVRYLGWQDLGRLTVQSLDDERLKEFCMSLASADST